MALVDDKLLGYKQQNYASSSEDEGEEEKPCCDEKGSSIAPPSYLGPKTGPKGVLQDYERYKELQKLERQAEEEERIANFKKKAFTADPERHEEDEFAEFEEDDDFLKMYHNKRLQQMKREAEEYLRGNKQMFGELKEISGSEFLDTIDKEKTDVIVLVHIYESSIPACIQMNKCLTCLAQQYPYVKFVKVKASEAGVSLKFKMNALPTLQIYKGGNLVGNFLRVQDNLDDEFYAADVENFLIDSDVLTEIAMSSKLLPSTCAANDGDDDDSDFELD